MLSPETTDKQAEKGRLNWFEVFVWGLVAVSLSIVITSLIESAIMRYQGVKWEDVAHVGDFWGGHLNSLALSALALGLLYQKRLLDGQRQELEKTQESLTKQLQAIENDTTQQSVHFLLAQLHEMSHKIEWVVTVLKLEGQPEHIRGKGIRDLSYHLGRQEGQPDLMYITVWPTELDEYINVSDATISELDKLNSSSGEMVKTVLGVLCPEALRSFHNSLTRKVNEDIAQWETMQLPESTRDILKFLSKRGYRFEILDVGEQYQVLAFNELEGAHYSSGNVFCATREEALQAMCERVR